jgi:hypothetical protein
MTYGQRVNHSCLITTLLYLTDGLSYESCSASIHLPSATDSLRMDDAYRIGASQVALGPFYIRTASSKIAGTLRFMLLPRRPSDSGASSHD